MLTLAACGGGGDGSSGPKATPVASVTLSQSSLTLAVGEATTLTATARDGAGNALTGRTVAWSSGNTQIAQVTPQGIVTGVAAGSTTITATIEGKTTQAQVVVNPAVASIAVSAPATQLDVGATLQLSATALDSKGTAVAGVPITWVSANDAIATVSTAGVVTGRAPGTVLISASSGNTVGSVTLNVRFPGGGSLTIASVAPSTLAPGTVTTITGTGFSTEPAQNVVTIAGVAATVTAATPTQLTVVVPNGGLPCRSSGAATVSVSSPFGAASREHQLDAATPRTLAVGQSIYLDGNTQMDCTELSSGGRYLVSVVNSAPASTSSAGFQLRTVAPTATLAAAPATSPSVVSATPLATGPTLRAAARLTSAREAGDDWRAAQRRAESRVRALDRQLIRQLGSPRRAWMQARSAARVAPSAGALASTALAGVKLTVGAKDTLKVVDITRGTCSSFTRVGARVVYVGPRAVVLEADDSPLAGTMDQDYIEIAQEFEQKMFPILTANFGNPLAYDHALDANDRIVMFFTKTVNNAGAGLLGYVFSCDFFPSTVNGASGSNQAEIFYARVPTTQTSSYTNTNERAVWKWRMRATLIHEVKHIVSYAELFETPIEGEYEESWLEEGTAQIAEELYGRTFWNTPWKGNATYAQTMHCDITPNPARFPECAALPGSPWPHAIGDHFFFLNDYALDHENKTFLSSGSEASHIYGSAWAFVRWAIDQYATSEPEFLKALVTSYVTRGVQNVEARTGRDFGELAAYFALAMASDDRLPFTPPAGAKYTFPSWNLASIWEGVVADIGRAPYDNPQPFAVRQGSFAAYNSGSISVAGASAAVFDLSGAAARALLELRSSSGAPLDRGTPLRVAILRVQ